MLFERHGIHQGTRHPLAGHIRYQALNVQVVGSAGDVKPIEDDPTVEMAAENEYQIGRQENCCGAAYRDEKRKNPSLVDAVVWGRYWV